MASTEQLDLLNPFIGRPEPSAELIARASALQDVYDNVLDSPSLVIFREAIERNDERYAATDSRIGRFLLGARRAGQVAMAVTANIDKCIRFVYTHTAFTSQLRREYGSAVLQPNPNPDFDSRPVLRKDVGYYAASILDIVGMHREPELADMP